MIWLLVFGTVAYHIKIADKANRVILILKNDAILKR